MQRLRAEAVSERQRQILDGIAAGKSNGVLADELGITVDGVKWHVSEMLWDTGCTDRHELADWWRRERPDTSLRVAFWPFGRSAHAFAVSTLRVGFMAALTAAIVGGIYLAATRGSSHNSAVVAPGTAATSSLGKIAYVQGGDIWTKSLPDGAPRRLTHFADDPKATDLYSMPAWAPSGGWLTFMKGKEPGVMRADGSAARYFPSVQPGPGALAWSPAADRLAYTDGAGNVIVENADGSARRRTVATPQRNTSGADDVSPPVWSANGTQLAYVEQRAAPQPPGPYAGIWVVDADGGAPPTEIYALPAGSHDGMQLISWARSPEILFARLPSSSADTADGLEIEVVRATAGVQPRLDPIAPRNPVGLLDPSMISRAATGDFIVVTDGTGRETWTHKQIGLLAPVTGVFYDITEPTVAAIDPAFSPHGRQIAYVAMPDAGTEIAGGDAAKVALAQRKIWVMNTQVGSTLGANKRELTSDAAYRDEDPQWSSDGRQIMFTRLNARDVWSVWMMGAGGSDEREVVPQIDINILGADNPVWFGSYGTIGWDSVLDWWQPAPAGAAPPPESTPGTIGPTAIATDIAPTATFPAQATVPAPLPSATPCAVIIITPAGTPLHIIGPGSQDRTIPQPYDVVEDRCTGRQFDADPVTHAELPSTSIPTDGTGPPSPVMGTVETPTPSRTVRP